MNEELIQKIEFDYGSDDEDVAEALESDSLAAFVVGTDWTTETIVSQLRRGNIQLNPRFQRRDAWAPDRKSRFIESLIVGLPIPQIVLAENKGARGEFLVLDGKQRLLSILQFWGFAAGKNNAYALSGLTLRPDLKGKTFADLSGNPSLEVDFNALCNQAVRTVVIRNWKDTDFLHTVFLRLNTGSVPLSPQELRQALLPGEFADHIDMTAGDSPGLHHLLGLAGPDPRMRDTEILARFLSFRFFANVYPGRMKAFLDDSFGKFNAGWTTLKPSVELAESDFEDGIEELIRVFGDKLARKSGSPQFNRAIFDALIYYHSQKGVRESLDGKDELVRNAYESLFQKGSAFLKAIESDTAGAPNTAARLKIWGATLSKVAGLTFVPPSIPAKTGTQVGSKRRR